MVISMNLKKTIKDIVFVSLLSLSTLSISACKEQFDIVDASIIQNRWEESIKHSAASWWYLGEKGGCYYILEKWPLESHGYKVSKEEITIEVDSRKELTFDESEWINLKV